ncbi:MAG: methylamine utilization protein MauE [Proteobacteria bacterium]|nr:methylamine utilization protein MauE [Pseudomonadota bacterium]
MIDPAIGLLLTGAFALLFATAAFHKFRDLALFSQVVRAYRLLPQALSVAPLVAAAEALAAAGLLVGTTRPAAALLGAALLLLYAVAIAVNLARGRRELSCGCGGYNERRPIAGWMVARNMVLAVLLAAIALPWSARPPQTVDLLTAGAGVAVAGLLYMSLDRLLGRIMPRTAAWESAP